MDNTKEYQVKVEGTLQLGDEIDCYVLENGMRILSARSMQKVLKMVDEAEKGKGTPGARLKRYLSQESLKPFIFNNKELGHFEPIICYKGKQKINGYEATTLVDICDGFLQARKTIHLSPRQKIIADQCEILVRSFAKVGIIALVDEATGYQYEREKKELQVILQALVSDEIIEYQRQFELSFYKEIFRLWNIPFTPQNIKRKPQFIGHLTNRYVYQNLPKGIFVLDKLKEKTPKNESGGYKYRLHQSLTKDKGREALKKVLYSVEALASIAQDKNDFDRLINEKYGQKEIPFPKDNEIEKALEKDRKNELNVFNKNLKTALEYNPKDKEPE